MGGTLQHSQRRQQAHPGKSRQSPSLRAPFVILRHTVSIASTDTPEQIVIDSAQGSLREAWLSRNLRQPAEETEETAHNRAHLGKPW